MLLDRVARMQERIRSLVQTPGARSFEVDLPQLAERTAPAPPRPGGALGTGARPASENRTQRGPPQRTGNPQMLQPAVQAGLPDGPHPHGLDPAGTRPHPLDAGDVDFLEIGLPGRRRGRGHKTGGDPLGCAFGLRGQGDRQEGGRRAEDLVHSLAEVSPPPQLRLDRNVDAEIKQRSRPYPVAPAHRFHPPAGGVGATLAAAGSGPSKESAPNGMPIRPAARGSQKKTALLGRPRQNDPGFPRVSSLRAPEIGDSGPESAKFCYTCARAVKQRAARCRRRPPEPLPDRLFDETDGPLLLGFPC